MNCSRSILAQVTLEAHLYNDLEIDSIDTIDLILRLKELTGRKIQPDQFRNVRTVGDAVTAIQRADASTSPRRRDAAARVYRAAAHGGRALRAPRSHRGLCRLRRSFPGTPILPAVAQIDWASAAARANLSALPRALPRAALAQIPANRAAAGARSRSSSRARPDGRAVIVHVRARAVLPAPAGA